MRDKDGYLYPLNGLAMNKYKGVSITRNLEDIWLIDKQRTDAFNEVFPEQPSIIRKDITKIFDRAMAICK